MTQEQYERVMGPGTNPSARKGEPARPVENVTWQEARDFCTRLSERPEEKAAGRRYRLPTEAEWEYACRAGTTTPFSCGDQLTGERANCNGGEDGGPVPVGSYPPNAWGLYDMHGNVAEWCADGHGPYPEGPLRDPTGPETGLSRVVRGGSWADPPSECRSAARGLERPAARSGRVGFRVVLRAD